MFWLAENHCVIAQSAASRNAEGRLDLHLRLRAYNLVRMRNLMRSEVPT
jgi:hypothetical protein